MTVCVPANAGPPDATRITELPKVELHVHLEGAIPVQRVVALAAARGQPLKRPVNHLFRTHTLDEFLANLDWMCSLVTAESEARQIALDFAAYARAQNIVYAEVIVNPTHWRGLDSESLLGAIAEGFDAAHLETGVDLRLLPSLLRQQPLDQALRLVDCMAALRHPRIAGLSIDGNQARAIDSSVRLAPAFERARTLGFATTAHAGESSGPEGVAAALDLLRVQRIDHGVRAAEDALLMQRLAREQVTLNVCLASNCHLLYADVDAHPLRQLLAAGVPCTLNTDDPVVLGTNLNDELVWAAAALDWTLDRLVAVQRTAIAAAFCSATDKAHLTAILDSNLTEHSDHDRTGD